MEHKFKFLRLPEVIETVNLSKPSIYRLMKLGLFPKARRLGERAVAWRSDEISEWQDTREVAE